MELIRDIFQVIAYASVAALCLYLIVVLKRVRVILSAMEENIAQIRAKAMPVLDNLQVITDKIRSITESIGDQVETIKDSLNSFKQIAENVLAFEQRVQAELEEPIVQTASTLAGVFRGIQGFIERIPFIAKLLA